MPQQLTQLCRLLGQTQNGEYSVAMSTHTFTTAFNLSKKHDLQEETEDVPLPMAGLSSNDVEHFTKSSSLDKKSLRQLHCFNHKYSWQV